MLFPFQKGCVDRHADSRRSRHRAQWAYRPDLQREATIMVTPRFFAAVHDNLGCEAAWLSRSVMRALMGLCRHHPEDDLHGARRDRSFFAPPAAAAVHPRAVAGLSRAQEGAGA